MKGAFFVGDRKVEVRDMPKPKPGVGEVLIQMKASGLCGSDLSVAPYRKPSIKLTQQERNVVGGHEPCGIVAKLGSCARGANIGDRVIVHHYVGCGRCKYCLTGWPQMCVKGTVVMGIHVNGGHEDYMVCPDTSCVPLPPELTFEEGAAVGCGTATAYQAVKRLALSGRDAVAVFGQGPVGVSVTMFAKAAGARVIAIDIVPERLELSRQLGADEIVNASEVDPVGVVKELTHGEGADASVECTGVDIARISTLKSTKSWGRACLLGEGGTTAFEVSPLIIHKQLTIHGSRTFSTHILAEAAKFVVDHKIPLRELIMHRYPLEKAEEAYHEFEKGKPGKSVIVW